MAFYSYQYNLGDVPVMHLPTSGITHFPGMALTLSSGVLSKATGTAKPEYISLLDGGGVSSTSGTIIPVEPVYASTVYETVLGKSISGLKPGVTCSLEATGLGIEAIDASGAVKVISCSGNTKGSRVKVTFITPASTTAAVSE